MEGLLRYTSYMRLLRSLPKKKIAGKVCLLRLDLNVIDEDPEDMHRLQASIPTLKLLLSSGAKVVIISHRGRPERPDRALSLKLFVPILKKKLKTDVVFLPHALPTSKQWGMDFDHLRWNIATSSKKVFLLENIRFFKGEEKNDIALARSLASLADFYVNDAFAVCHRKNASISAVTKFLPSYAGLLLELEVASLGKAMKKPSHPFAVIIGGAKVKEKLDLMKVFWKNADAFLLGGGIANTCFAAEGEDIGNSLYDETLLRDAKRYVKAPKVYLPLDDLQYKRKILDIGPQTAEEYSRIISHSKTILWSGPMGFYHEKRFSKGTEKMWRAVVSRTKAKDTFSIIGGGETIASMELIGESPVSLAKKRKNIFVSTGGGAMIEFLAGKKLPGIEALK